MDYILNNNKLKLPVFWRQKTLIFVLFIIALSGVAQKPNDLFIEGNKLYKQAKYNEAIEKFIEIEKQNLQSAELFYNLGNAYYKTNNVAPAIYYYEKALKIAPNNKDIAVNLKFAQRMTIDNIKPLPSHVFQKISRNFIQKIRFNSWAYYSVFFALLFALLFLLYHFSDSSGKKRTYFMTGTFSLVLALLSLLFAFHTYKVTSNKREAIIFIQQTQVKDAPLLSGKNVFRLHEGTKVTVLKSQDNWKKIKIIDGQTGWIIASELKEF
ncbi:MAG: tetratricopeptide repeat protein [Flavobacteriaceae bacterium]